MDDPCAGLRLKVLGPLFAICEVFLGRQRQEREDSYRCPPSKICKRHAMAHLENAALACSLKRSVGSSCVAIEQTSGCSERLATASGDHHCSCPRSCGWSCPHRCSMRTVWYWTGRVMIVGRISIHGMPSSCRSHRSHRTVDLMGPLTCLMETRPWRCEWCMLWCRWSDWLSELLARDRLWLRGCFFRQSLCLGCPCRLCQLSLDCFQHVRGRRCLGLRWYHASLDLRFGCWPSLRNRWPSRRHYWPNFRNRWPSLRNRWPSVRHRWPSFRNRWPSLRNC